MLIYVDIWWYMMVFDDICENPNVQNLGVTSMCSPSNWMSMRGRCLDLSGKLPEVYPVEYGSKVPWAMDTADFWVSQLGLSENSAPLHPMVLLIIIPIKWLFHWEYNLFSDKPNWLLCVDLRWSASAEIKKHDFLASFEKAAQQVMPAWSEPESCRISPKQSQ